MNDTLTKERQQELFEEFSPSSPKRVERIPTLAKSHKPILITTTTEQLLLTSIIGILVLCAVFFMGVLRGKSLQNTIMGEPVVNVQPHRTAVVVARAVAPAASVAQAPVVRPQAQMPAATAATTSSEASVALKPYTIQLVTHRGKSMADAEVASLRKSGQISFIIPSGEYYQVCVGQFFSKEEAKKYLPTFSRRFKDSFVRRR